jgi:hypothetical protein
VVTVEAERSRDSTGDRARRIVTSVITGAQAMATLPLPTAQTVDILAQFARVTDH